MLRKWEIKHKLDLTLRFCCILLCVHFQNLAKPMSEKQAALIFCCSYSGKQTAGVKSRKVIEYLGLVCFVFLNRTTLCTPELNLSDENTNSCYQLWSSVCSTLCACVNNPQNGKCCCLKTVKLQVLFSLLLFSWNFTLCLDLRLFVFTFPEANQKICCSVFPYAKEWLESCMEPEIVRPICSFVGLTVANNCKKKL